MGRRDRDAEFKAFYFAEATKLKRLALYMTGDPDKASDLSQEALLKAYRAWNRIKDGDPGPYVRRILVNLCRNEYRRRALELRKPQQPPGDVESLDRQVDESLRVAEALKVLSPIRKATIVLRFYEDMPEAQIAEVLDRPLNTVKSDIRRALQALRPLLEEGATTT